MTSALLAQNDVKFRPSGNDRVVLMLDVDDDPEVIARQLAGTYGVQVAGHASAGVLEIIASETKARLLSGDRRVVLVERTPTTNARPSEATTHAPGGFGAYEYDGAGNVTTLGSDSFVYDAFGRIHTATVSGSTQTFTYDRHGNITNITTTGPSGTSDRPIGVGTGNRLSGATYDGSGNLLSYHGGTFLYDGLNMVTEWTPTGGGNRRVYIYTADNERIATVEVLPDGTRRTDWTIRDMDGNVLRRYRTHPNGAWSWEEDYIYRGSQLLAAEVPTPEKVRHFHVDHLGTPRLITGNGGAKLVERAYGAFGEAFTGNASQQVTPEPNEPVQFTGHERDNFQRDYMHARYYDPLMGRFLSVDPMLGAPNMPQSWNRYSYVFNNPVRFVDPAGRYPCPVVGSDGVERTGECIDVEGKKPQVDGTTVSLLTRWLIGRINARELTASDEDAEALARTPAWQNVKDQLVAADCAPGVYYPQDFGPREFFMTSSVTGHLVGGFGANVLPLNDGRMAVNAQNVWGRASLSRWPLVDRRAPALQDFRGWLVAAAHGSPGPVSPLPPSSTLHDVATGYLANVTVNYYWTEVSPCQN